jgi:hypothetical protein
MPIVNQQLVFACQRTGLANALRGDLLGGYDGVGGWSVFVEQIRGADEHLVVQAHEALHHELQTSTVWGCLTSGGCDARTVGQRPVWGSVDEPRDEQRLLVVRLAAQPRSAAVGLDDFERCGALDRLLDGHGRLPEEVGHGRRDP